MAQNSFNSTHSTASRFNQAHSSGYERFLLHLRAASLNPTIIARAIEKSTSHLARKDVNVLEPGCGIGAKTQLIKSILQDLGCQGISIKGVDISKSAIEYAQQLGSIGADYQQADFMDLEGDFDYIFLIAVWQHFEDTRQAIQKIAELLKPNGVAVILNNFFSESPLMHTISRILFQIYQKIVKREGVHYNHTSVKEIQELVRQNSDLIYQGDFSVNAPAIFVRGLVIQKQADPKSSEASVQP